MLRVIIALIVGYLVLLSLVFIFQRRLLYYPALGRSPDIAPPGMQIWPTNGNDFRGYIALSDNAPSRGTVIIFHGNAGTARDRYFYVDALRPMNYHVLLAEYPGYGGRPGVPGERLFVTDAVETVQLALAEFGSPLYLFGESLGCGVACAVAADTTMGVRGVALFTPWDSLPNLAQKIYWFLPARWLVRDKYDNIANLIGCKNRVAIVLAGQDEIIPNERSMTLFRSIACEKKIWLVEGAGHNTWPDKLHKSEWKEILEFLSEPSIENNLLQ